MKVIAFGHILHLPVQWTSVCVRFLSHWLHMNSFTSSPTSANITTKPKYKYKTETKKLMWTYDEMHTQLQIL
jgi:hypothetical protein